MLQCTIELLADIAALTASRAPGTQLLRWRVQAAAVARSHAVPPPYRIAVGVLLLPSFLLAVDPFCSTSQAPVVGEIHHASSAPTQLLTRTAPTHPSLLADPLSSPFTARVGRASVFRRQCSVMPPRAPPPWPDSPRAALSTPFLVSASMCYRDAYKPLCFVSHAPELPER